jgi:uncharacterized protein (TIGR00645 family)
VSKPETRIETWLERALFASRWLMAPFYLGLAIALAALLAVFVQELLHDVPKVVMSAKPDDAVVMALSLIDLSLAANLMVIVILAGYENFVSKITVATPAKRPDWMGKLSYSDMKMKLIASIVAISAVALLRLFMSLAEPGAVPDPVKLGWLIGLHLTFVVSALMLAVTDWLESRADHGRAE